MAASGGVGGIEWLDIETMIDEGISQGIVDPYRIGIAGYSQGGFLAAFGCTRPNNKFKAGVVGAGVTDWGILAATSDIPDLEVRYKTSGSDAVQAQKIL
jgi:dipeptidyl aminopeptidase/acylaminoacyl peptidase